MGKHIFSVNDNKRARINFSLTSKGNTNAEVVVIIYKNITPCLLISCSL